MDATGTINPADLNALGMSRRVAFHLIPSQPAAFSLPILPPPSSSRVARPAATDAIASCKGLSMSSNPLTPAQSQRGLKRSRSPENRQATSADDDPDNGNSCSSCLPVHENPL